jgi:Tfp pilus assembly protein PilV
MKAHRRNRQAGVSLIEALVALAVMAFGILGVVGIQSTLRSNADLSRQRAEAVRIAAQTIESWRAYTTLSPNGAQTAYDDLVSQAAAPVPDPSPDPNAPFYNTTYTLQQTVALAPVGRAKTLRVDVSWTDRSNLTQQVSLSTLIFGTAPELAGSLLLPGDASTTQQAKGRNAAVPLGAINNPGGTTSDFNPPSSSSLTWVFNNTTGVITSICNPSCVPANSFLVSGYINFDLTSAPSASSPQSSPLIDSGASAMTVSVNVTAPALGNVPCYHDVATGTPGYVAYFCAIPIPAPPAVQRWSGGATLQLSTGLSPAVISSTLADTSTANFKVCRYTSVASDTTPNNSDHPLNYDKVVSPLINQNFLVVGAPAVNAVTVVNSGDKICPIDGSPQAITFRHQPLL